MHFFLLYDPPKQWKENSDKQPFDPIQEPPHNITEGSEFLDDAIRTDDQPIIYTEESVAAGSPKDLL